MEKAMIKLMDNCDWSIYAIIVVNYDPKILKYDKLVYKVQDTIDDVREKYPDDYTYDDVYNALTSKFNCEIYEISNIAHVEY